MKRKFTGSTTIAIALFVTSGVLASALGIRQVDRLSTTTAVVLSQDLKAGDTITSSVLTRRKTDKDDSEQSVQNPQQLLGKVLNVAKRKGDVVFANELILPTVKSLSYAVPEGRVLFTLSQLPTGLPFAKLNQGDRFDILVRGRKRVRTVARNVQLIGVLKPPKKTNNSKGAIDSLNAQSANSSNGALALVMAVRPGDVYPLASIGASDIVSIVLHSAYDIANGTQPLLGMAQTHRDIIIHSGNSRKTVSIERE
ncbi:hypothetical protein [Shewanella sp. Arc9-LZ]|jgi:hypothetical protein|uniref:SAF domain-containing protein n=1 Tax=Shewanella sp. Arc9-LZ TaxID=2698686 RepID=UPI00137C0D8E|nr:hypothetical protein [Shewanella sp. Arc9-LZ]QHS13627.1 hypothetical protein GUY17_11105 [Shewanella sp. Arc9-LZ]